MKKIYVLALSLLMLLGVLNNSVASFSESDLESEGVTPKAQTAEVLGQWLWNAIREKQWSDVKQLIKDGASIEVRENGDTILNQIVALSDKFPALIDIVGMVLEAGANVNEVNAVSNWTPLMHAVYANRGDIVQLLLEAGAKINVKNVQGHTALLVACRCCKELNFGLMRLLLSAGADVNDRNENAGENNQTALLCAMDKIIWSSLNDDSVREKGSLVIRLLVLAGADVSVLTEEEKEWGFEEVITQAVEDKALYDSRCDVVLSVLREDTPLPETIVDLVQEYEEVVEELVFLKERARNLKKRA